MEQSGRGRVLHKILSIIRVAELFATQVGLEIRGKKEPDMNISRMINMHQ